MPIYLLIAIVVGVFVMCAAAFLLILALMRVAEMRGALVEAGVRIQALEESLCALKLGVLVARQVDDPELLEKAPSPAITAGPPQPEPAARPSKPAPQPQQAAPRPTSPPPPSAEPRPAPPSSTAPERDWSWAPISAAMAAAGLLITSSFGFISATVGFVSAFSLGAVVALAGFLSRAQKNNLAPALGFAAMAAALIVAAGPLGLGPAPLAYLGLAAVTVVAAGAAPWGGMTLAVGALLVGLVAPLLIPLGPQGAAVTYGHILALTAAALAGAAISASLRPWALFAAAGALAWGVAGAIQGQDAAPAYLAALGALGLGLWWPEAKAPVDWRRPFAKVKAVREPGKIGVAVLLASCAFLLITQARAAPELAAFSALALVMLAAIAHLAALSRPGFALVAALVTMAGVAAIALWPAHARYPFVGLDPAHAAFATGATLAAIATLAGWLALPRPNARVEAVGFAGVAPLAILGAAAIRMQGQDSILVGAAAFVITLSCAVLAYALAPPPGAKASRKPDAAALAVAGAAGAFALASAAPAQWLTIALALMVPAFVWIDRRREGAALALAALLIALVVLYRLATPWTVAAIAAGETPIFNLLTPIYAGSALALWAGAWLLKDAAWPRAAIAAQGLNAGALVAAALWAVVQLRHGFGAGDVAAPIATLTELGLQASVWLVLALLIRHGFIAPRTPALSALELAAVGLGAAIAAIGAGWLANPWWGMWPGAAPDAPVLNALVVAFALPAAGLLLWGLSAAARDRPWTGRAAFATAALLFLVHIVLEMRRGFAGTNMASAEAGIGEMAAYTAVMLAFGAALLALGLERRGRALRWSSLGLGFAAIAKFVLFDLSGSDPAMRILGVIAALVAAAALIWFYQTYVFARQDTHRSTAESDPAPPT